MGGAEYQVKCLIDKLIPLDRFDIIYLTKSYDKAFHNNNYKIMEISNGNSIPKLAGLFFLDAFRIWKLLNIIHPDVILQRVGCAYTGIAANYAIKNGCNMIFHVSIDNDILLIPYGKSSSKLIHKIDYLFIDYALKNCPHIITQTHQQAIYLKERYHRMPAAVIPNFHPLPEGEVRKTDPVKVVWVANFKPSKQPELFVRLAGCARQMR